MIYKNFKYKKNADNTVTITSYVQKFFKKESVIEIPETINDYPVSEIGPNCFSYDQNITEIKIPNTVKTIGMLAFSNCKNLKNINIPSSVKKIDVGVFHNVQLENIEMNFDNRIDAFMLFSNMNNIKNLTIDGKFDDFTLLTICENCNIENLKVNIKTNGCVLSIFNKCNIKNAEINHLDFLQLCTIENLDINCNDFCSNLKGNNLITNLNINTNKMSYSNITADNIVLNTQNFCSIGINCKNLKIENTPGITMSDLRIVCDELLFCVDDLEENSCAEIFGIIKKIILDDNIKKLNPMTFFNCDVNEVVFNNKLNYIGASVFKFLNKYNNIPDTIEIMYNFVNKNTIDIDKLPKDKFFITEDAIYTKDKKSLIYLNTKNENYILPSHVETILDNAIINQNFKNFICSNVKEIQMFAFYQTSIEQLYLSKECTICHIDPYNISNIYINGYTHLINEFEETDDLNIYCNENNIKLYDKTYENCYLLENQIAKIYEEMNNIGINLLNQNKIIKIIKQSDYLGYLIKNNLYFLDSKDLINIIENIKNNNYDIINDIILTEKKYSKEKFL